MQTTITIDDTLLAKAKEAAGVNEDAEVVAAALQALVQRHAARELAKLGGSEPQLKPVYRQRSA